MKILTLFMKMKKQCTQRHTKHTNFFDFFRKKYIHVPIKGVYYKCQRKGKVPKTGMEKRMVRNIKITLAINTEELTMEDVDCMDLTDESMFSLASWGDMKISIPEASRFISQFLYKVSNKDIEE